MADPELSPHLFEHEDAVGRLLSALRSGGPRAREIARRHLSAERDRGFGLADAEEVYARRLGIDGWRELRRRVFLEGGPDGELRPTGEALHRAVSKGRLDVVEWLLGNGARPDAPANHPKGSRPLHMAAVGGSLEIVRVLLEAGADPNRKDDAFDAPPLGYARWARNEDVADLLAPITD